MDVAELKNLLIVESSLGGIRVNFHRFSYIKSSEADL